ncbi:hypothetical protein J2S00_003377 [Caldalkalibacillus uzonensis]|uniref:DUF4127 family protein n=1 Tax=Caldalkalibacillus uzonensis TaxID=353224 RepID=A0ABU0CVV6_9BACI|nr:DUF4127 family protein [Caldalkalibacillus uzonensis]MDQ0340553.1 hypothetical protein [Caldalkalibacillus uzonensis]
MKKVKKLICLMMVFSLCTTAFFSLPMSDVHALGKQGKVKPLATILLVPLDDRPANIYFPQHIGKAAGIDVLIPPREKLGYFTSPGDGEAIGEWLLEQGDHADAFVISVSMLAYGGLIASRTGIQSYEKAVENVQIIKNIREKYPDKPIYVYDTIQRLAVTAISDEYLEYYNEVREWAILYDKVVNLGMEEGRERLEELQRTIPPHVLEDYLNARARNHQINQLLVDWVDEGIIDFLILAQDDAAEYGLHRAEREVLVNKIEQLQVQDRAFVFPGADEIDAVLVARFVNQLLKQSPAFYVEYAGIHGSEWIAPFEDTTFDYNVEKHILAAGGTIVENQEDADIYLLLNTPSDNRPEDINKLVNRIKELIDLNKQVAIGDVIEVNRSEAVFVEMLLEQIDVTKLLAYSGWNTAGNTLGITIGHAASRYTFLEQTSGMGVPQYLHAAKAHYEFLLHRFAKDDGYKNVVHPRARNFIQSIGGSEWDLGDHYDEVNGFVQEQLKSETENYFEHFAGKEVYIGSRGNKDFYATISKLEDVHVKLPWPRIFEAELEPILILE